MSAIYLTYRVLKQIYENKLRKLIWIPSCHHDNTCQLRDYCASTDVSMLACEGYLVSCPCAQIQLMESSGLKALNRWFLIMSKSFHSS